MNTFKTLILLGSIFIAVTWGQNNADGGLIASVFGVPDSNGIVTGTANTLPPNTNSNNNFTNNNDTSYEIDCGPGYDCVPYYLCNDNYTIIKHGEGLIDIRIDDDNKNSKCPLIDTCCAISNKVESPIIGTTNRPKSTGCGYRNIDGIGFRILGSQNEAQYAEFPWVVAILKQEVRAGKVLKIYACSGSLIHPRVILTAAHCVVGRPRDVFSVRAGDWDASSKLEMFPTQERNVSEIITHSNYYAGALFNDIALVLLDKPMELAENIQTVCLPPSNIQFDQQRCFATGWGKNSFGIGGRYQSILKKVELPVVPRDQCQNSLRTTRLGKYFELHQSFICAGGEPGKDTCTGDGGSPLICPVPGTSNRYYQAGIVSWGIGCGDSVPAVYVSVSELRNWIDLMVTRKQIDSSFFTP